MKLVQALLVSCLVIGGGIMLAKNMNTKDEAMAPQGIVLDRAVKVKYCNYRGEVGIRSIIPMEVYWGQTEYHPHDQWLLKVWDIEKNAERIYAFKDIQEFGCK